MNTSRVPLLLCLVAATALAGAAWANTAPTPVIVSAAMRPGTTYLDVVFRVNDPDNTTVQVRALAFINGTRSFANVIRPTAFVGDTSAVLGSAVPTNTDRALTWDVAADWNVELGQLKFEILCRDERGLLAFDWITIPAAGEHAALTISKDTPPDAKVLDALFWEFAGGGNRVTLAADGVLRGGADAEQFVGAILASGASLASYARPFVFWRMNLEAASVAEVNFAHTTARAALLNTGNWHALNRTSHRYAGFVTGWGEPGRLGWPIGRAAYESVAGGNAHSVAIRTDGTVVAWGSNDYGESNVPVGLANVVKISVGERHAYALKADGSLVGWGRYYEEQLSTPAALGPVKDVACGLYHNAVIKEDGTLVGWASWMWSEASASLPSGLSNLKAVAAGGKNTYLLKEDGTVVAGGNSNFGQLSVPAGLSNVKALAAGYYHCLALREDGTVVAWGSNEYGQCNVPAGLSGVKQIAAGHHHSVALKEDGTVVAWGWNNYDQCSVPAGLPKVRAIGAGAYHTLVLLEGAED